MCKKSFFDFMREEEKLLKENNQVKTAASYLDTLKSFSKFRKLEEGGFEIITSEEMQRYEHWLKGRGVKLNTISYYMRVLRAVYNKAVDKDLIPQKHPFRSVYTGIEKTQKRAVGVDVILKIKEFDLSYDQHLDYARDLFMFSFYLRGISFIDMAFLRKEDCRDGVITYNRKKTGQKLVIKMEPCMVQIIEKYKHLAEDTIYLLPIIRSDNPRSSQAQYYNALRYQNKQLKKVGILLQIPGLNLTSYVARHSWASIARSNEIPISIISESMGHTSEAVTRIYLQSLDQVKLDQANRKILSCFL